VVVEEENASIEDTVWAVVAGGGPTGTGVVGHATQ